MPSVTISPDLKTRIIDKLANRYADSVIDTIESGDYRDAAVRLRNCSRELLDAQRIFEITEEANARAATFSDFLDSVYAQINDADTPGPMFGPRVN